MRADRRADDARAIRPKAGDSAKQRRFPEPEGPDSKTDSPLANVRCPAVTMRRPSGKDSRTPSSEMGEPAGADASSAVSRRASAASMASPKEVKRSSTALKLASEV